MSILRASAFLSASACFSSSSSAAFLAALALATASTSRLAFSFASAFAVNISFKAFAMMSFTHLLVTAALEQSSTTASVNHGINSCSTSLCTGS